MTESKTQSVRLTRALFDKALALAEQLYPHRPARRFSEIVARLLRAATVVDGKLVADEREVDNAAR